MRITKEKCQKCVFYRESDKICRFALPRFVHQPWLLFNDCPVLHQEKIELDCFNKKGKATDVFEILRFLMQHDISDFEIEQVINKLDRRIIKYIAWIMKDSWLKPEIFVRKNALKFSPPQSGAGYDKARIALKRDRMLALNKNIPTAQELIEKDTGIQLDTEEKRIKFLYILMFVHNRSIELKQGDIK